MLKYHRSFFCLPVSWHAGLFFKTMSLPRAVWLQHVVRLWIEMLIGCVIVAWFHQHLRLAGCGRSHDLRLRFSDDCHSVSANACSMPIVQLPGARWRDRSLDSGQILSIHNAVVHIGLSAVDGDDHLLERNLIGNRTIFFIFDIAPRKQQGVPENYKRLLAALYDGQPRPVGKIRKFQIQRGI